LAGIDHEGGDLKKAKFHLEAAAMAGHDVSPFKFRKQGMTYHDLTLGVWRRTIAASAGDYTSMHHL